MAKDSDTAPPADEVGGAPRRTKGQMIYDRIEQMVEAQGVTRSAAFDQLAQETGDKAGTIAANYYRIARQHGDPQTARVTRAKRDQGSLSAALDVAIEDLRNVIEALDRGNPRT